MSGGRLGAGAVSSFLTTQTVEGTAAAIRMGLGSRGQLGMMAGRHAAAHIAGALDVPYERAQRMIQRWVRSGQAPSESFEVAMEAFAARPEVRGVTGGTAGQFLGLLRGVSRAGISQAESTRMAREMFRFGEERRAPMGIMGRFAESGVSGAVGTIVDILEKILNVLTPEDVKAVEKIAKVRNIEADAGSGISEEETTEYATAGMEHRTGQWIGGL
jgi:hypothetical protein